MTASALSGARGIPAFVQETSVYTAVSWVGSGRPPPDSVYNKPSSQRIFMVGLDHGRFFGGSDSGVSSCGMLPCGGGGGGGVFFLDQFSSSSFLLLNQYDLRTHLPSERPRAVRGSDSEITHFRGVLQVPPPCPSPSRRRPSIERLVPDRRDWKQTACRRRWICPCPACSTPLRRSDRQWVEVSCAGTAAMPREPMFLHPDLPVARPAGDGHMRTSE